MTGIHTLDRRIQWFVDRHRHCGGSRAHRFPAACQDTRDGKQSGAQVPAAQAIAGVAEDGRRRLLQGRHHRRGHGRGGRRSCAAPIQSASSPTSRPPARSTRPACTAQSLPGGERAILLGDYFYAKVPQQLSQFTGGKPVKFSVSQAQQAGPASTSTRVIKRADPAEQTKIFTGVQGREEGRHREHQRREDHPLPGHGHAGAGGPARPQGPGGVQALLPASSGANKVTFDLWVGKDNLPRKLVPGSRPNKGTRLRDDDLQRLQQVVLGERAPGQRGDRRHRAARIPSAARPTDFSVADQAISLNQERPVT